VHGITLLNFLRDLPARTALVAALGGDPAPVCAYYICPLSNLRGIAIDGIHPHATAPAGRTDLSGASVQERRDVDLRLTKGKEVTLHHCVNLFWNPLSWTCRAFQRNALLREAESNNSDAGVVCILELDAEAILQDPQYAWTASPVNLAAWGFNSFVGEFTTGQRRMKNDQPYFDWNDILSVGDNDDAKRNQKRAAELIVFRELEWMQGSSSPVQFAHIRRILLPDASLRALTPEQAGFLQGTGKLLTTFPQHAYPKVFFERDFLLWPERQFVVNLKGRMQTDAEALTKLNAALTAIAEFEEKHPDLSPVAARFTQSEVAGGWHGSAHISRVMFWAAFLAQHLSEQVRTRFLEPLLCAAAVHDLCREGNEEDQVHGQLAAQREQPRIEQKLNDPALSASCLEAVRLHCLPDEQCANRDLVWEILKDADSLDRGRFGKPNQSVGCDASFFRTDILRNAPDERILWMAYYLPQVTRYLDVSASPCRRLSEALVCGVKAAYPD
jgi:hypothetical protein